MIVKFRFFLIAGLLTLTVFSVDQVQTQTPPNSLDYSPEQNYVITFLNYDESLVDVVDIELSLPTSIVYNLDYKINYEFNFANTSYSSQVNNYIDTISTNDWTSSLNETALTEQKTNFQRKDIFTRQNGLAIDARKLETYLANNLPQTSLSNENLFHIFVMNNSRYDTLSADHWFNVTEVDPDANRPRFFWRLEWDYPQNFDVKFPYAAFSESQELAILDPTAFQWYLRWRAIWNVNTQIHDSYLNDLDRLNEGQSIAFKKAMTTSTIKNWLEDWLFNIFNMQTGPVELGTSISLQLKVGYNSSEIDLQNIEWIVNAEYTKEITNTLVQTNLFTVDVEYLDVSNDVIMSNLINSNQVNYIDFQGASPPFENWKFYDGINIFNDIASDPTITSNYFDLDAADIVVRGVVLLLDNASFVGASYFIPWAGGLYTGLGGNFQVTMLWELDRALMPNHTTRKAGLSRVLVHEIGHSIGLPHTFTDRFTSDFISDVMGYYPSSGNYSQLVMKKYQRDSADQKLLAFKTAYDNAIIIGDKSNEVLSNAYNSFLSFIENHKSKNYLQAFFNAKEGLRILVENDGGIISSSNNIQSTSSQNTDGSTITTNSADNIIKTDDKSLPFSSTYSMIALVMIIWISGVRTKRRIT